MTELRTIDVDEALKELERAVNEKGADFIHPGPCDYEFGGKPSCLIGHVLFNLGVSAEDLDRMDQPDIAEEDDGTPPNGTSIGDVAFMLPRMTYFTLTPRAITALAAAQYEQDHGYTWGFALDSARRTVEDESAGT